jgi:hypothetical protein
MIGSTTGMHDVFVDARVDEDCVARVVDQIGAEDVVTQLDPGRDRLGGELVHPPAHSPDEASTSA